MDIEKNPKDQKINRFKTFPVPSSLEEIRKNLTILTNPPRKKSKEEIINQAITLHSEGKTYEAGKYYQYCINKGFNDQIVLSNYGLILRDLGKLKEAELLTRKAIEIQPNFFEAYSNLGTILKDLGNLKEAELFTRKAIELKPNLAENHYNLGNILKDLCNLKEAELFIRKAIELRPDYVDAYLNLGVILLDIGNLKEAELIAKKAIVIKPDFVDAHLNLGSIFKELGKLEEAKDEFKKCIELEPNKNSHIANLLEILSTLCSWDEIENFLPCLESLGLRGNPVVPINLMYLEDNPENHLKRTIKYNQANQESKRKFLDNHNSYDNSKINIGYFSSDFRYHAVSILITRILELHDKSRFNIYAYSLSKDNDSYTQRVKNAVYCFREVSLLSDDEIVNIVRKDKIDIAIDLNGLTKLNRRNIFNHRLAPKQINYLGYPGTMGSKSFDYIIADKIAIPEENRKFYTEKVLYLPNSFLPNDDTKQISPRKFRKEDLGLPTNGFIFTCFNHTNKITRKEFNIWMNLLQKVKGSVLWILKPHPLAINNIYQELRKKGLDRKRVVFAERMKLDEHLSRHSCGDLFLDTFNYNAGTTASDSLWAGLPLITLSGRSFCARAGASILNACNLNELITHNEFEYELLAYELATNKERLDKISKKLKEKSSPFFNTSKYTKNLENIYIKIVNQ